MRKIVYDVELYKNIFLLIAKDIDTGERFVFEISRRKDNRRELLIFLKTVEYMVGFNNCRFDYNVLHLFISLFKRKIPGKRMVELLYLKGQECISKERPNINKKPLVKQKDLFLINHYDNYNKSTSLKILEFNMQMDDVAVLPYKFDKILTDEEIEHLVIYCDNDIEATYQFYLKNIKAINFRDKMSKLYNYDFSNYNDVKIGERILLKAVAKYSGESEYAIQKLRTYRTAMNMSDIIFDYISFDTKELNILLDWWKDKVIFETKGQFNKLDMDDVAPLLPYCNNETEKSKLKNLNIIVDGLQFDFGTGGLHAACYPGVWKATENTEIILLDVSSYYPNLASKNRLHPKHIDVDVFVKTIDMLYGQRMKAKDEGDDETVAGIKLALNGALYGKSNSEYSFMYDPQFMMSICVNGQLLLAKLAEKCIINGIKVIQVNTDGVMVECPRNKRHLLDEIAKEWMELTNLKLDYDHFNLVVQKDVNNYLAVFTNGKIKYKGVFDYDYANNGDWHKNFSSLIIPKALKAYFIDGIRPARFITEHADFYDFFKRTKFDKRTRLVQREFDKDNTLLQQTLLQNITRYYVSRKGKNFVKIMPPLKGKEEDREFVIESGYLCTEINSITQEKVNTMIEELDYGYYITKVLEIVHLIEDYVPIEELTFEIIDDI